jgi:hypothetical protein
VKNEPITDFIITPHAAFEMQRRSITAELVQAVLAKPEQRLEVRAGRIVLQTRIAMGLPERVYLVRIFVDVDRVPAEIVTLYRTSKIEKYWNEEES